MKVRDIISDTLWAPGFGYSDDQKPAISILMPMYREGAGELFRKSVESILDQTLRDIELIIVDDASTDGTADQIADFMRYDDRVSYLRHPRNVGLPAVAAFEAFAKARADFVIFAFDDVIFYPDAFENLLKQCQNSPDKICYGYFEMRAQDTGSFAIRSVRIGQSLASNNLRDRNVIPSSGVILPRRVIESVGLFDPNIIMNEVYDWDLWRRIGERYLLHYIDVGIGEIVYSDTKDTILAADAAEEWVRSGRRSTKQKDLIEIDVFSSRPGISKRTAATLADLAATHIVKRPWLDSNFDSGDSMEEKKVIILTSAYTASTSLYFDSLPNSIQGSLRIIVSSGMENISELASASCLILVRAIDTHMEWINAAGRLGIDIYYFLDDNFTELAAVEGYVNSEDFSLDRLRVKLERFSGVLLSTSELLEYFEANLIHPNLFLFPVSYAKTPLELPSRNVDSRFDLTIASIGGRHRQHGLQQCVLPALHRLAGDTCRIHFVVGGVDPSEFGSMRLENRNLKVTFLPYDIDWNRALLQLAEHRPDILIHAPSKTVNNKYKTLNVALCAYLLDALLVVPNDLPFNISSFDDASMRVDPPLQPRAWFHALGNLIAARETWDRYKRVNAIYCRTNFSGEQNLIVLNKILRGAPAVSSMLLEARLKEIFFSKASVAMGRKSDTESLKISLLELSALRAKIRRYRRFKPRLSRDDLWKGISPAFDEIREYVIEHKIRTAKNYLELSDAIQSKNFVEYPVMLRRGALKSISCAFSSEGFHEGLVGVELVDPRGEIAIHATTVLDSASLQFPVTFDLKEAIVPEDGRWQMRLFARSNWPIYVLEFATYSYLGWARKAVAPFASIEYAEQAQRTRKAGKGGDGRAELAASSDRLPQPRNAIQPAPTIPAADLLVIIESEFATTHLIEQIMRACGAHGIRYRTQFLGRLQASDIAHNTIPLFVRCADPMVMTWAQALVDTKRPYVYYIDDNFWRIPGRTPLAEYYRHPTTRKSLEFAISHAEAVIVNSAELAKFVSAFSDEVTILPTFFDFSLIEGTQPSPTDEIRIGFAGSLPRIDDLDLISGVIEPILSKFPGTVFEFAGVLPRGIKVGPRVRFFPHIGDYSAFIRFQAERNWAIGLAPLVDNEANRSKTDNKYREYSACRIAGIYSNIPPYRGVVRPSVNGLLVDSAETSWIEALTYLLEQPGERASMANVAYEDAKSRYDVTSVSKEWARFFKQVANKGNEDPAPLDQSSLNFKRLWRRLERIKLHLSIIYKEGGVSLVTRRIVSKLLS